MNTDAIDWSSIAAIAVCIVGLTQVIKNLIGREVKGRWAVMLTLLVGAVICVVYFFFTAHWVKICTVLLSLSAASIFYDTIYQRFKKILETLGERGTA